MGGPNVYYIHKKTLEEVKGLVKGNKPLTKDHYQKLTGESDNLTDADVMTPVDMRGIQGDFDDVEQMAQKLGVAGACKAFIQAKDYFDQNKGKDLPEDERPGEMTLGEWK